MKLVSICIPTYNGAQYIAEAMDSAISQTYTNLEIVVSDDASGDETLNIIESYKTKTEIPISIYHHIPNGIGANWNHCIKKANGDYIKFLFQDDQLEPDCVKQMIGVLEAENSIGLVASKRTFLIEDAFNIEDQEKWVKTYENLQFGLNLINENGIALLDRQLFKDPSFFVSPLNKVGEPTAVMFSKRLVDKIGYFREDLKQILDYEFYYRVLKSHQIAIIEKPLIKFRLHRAQATVSNRGSLESVEYFQDEIYRKFFFQLPKKKVLNYFKNKIVELFTNVKN